MVDKICPLEVPEMMNTLQYITGRDRFFEMHKFTGYLQADIGSFDGYGSNIVCSFINAWLFFYRTSKSAEGC